MQFMQYIRLVHNMLTAESGFFIPSGKGRGSIIQWLGRMVPAAAAETNGPLPAGKAKQRGPISRSGMPEAKDAGPLATGHGSRTADEKVKAATAAKALPSILVTHHCNPCSDHRSLQNADHHIHPYQLVPSSPLPLLQLCMCLLSNPEKTKLKRSSGSSRRSPSTCSSQPCQSSSVERPSRRRRGHTPGNHKKAPKKQKAKNRKSQNP